MRLDQSSVALVDAIKGAIDWAGPSVCSKLVIFTVKFDRFNPCDITGIKPFIETFN